MAAHGSPEALFSARLAADPSGPLLTFYDDATGERAELSARSLGNWVAKTHFLLTDSLGLGPSDRALVRLPVHWLAAPILLGCWFAGLEVSSGAGEAVAGGGAADGATVADEVAVAFADADSLAGLTGLGGAEVFAVSLLSMARPGSPPPGAEDYALAARPMPDAWAGVRAQAGPDDPALDGLSRAEVAAQAVRTAGELGLATGGRLLWNRGWPASADWIAALLAPLAVGGSVVLVRNPEPAKLAARIAAEQVSVTR